MNRMVLKKRLLIRVFWVMFPFLGPIPHGFAALENGESTLSEMNCVACHQADAQVEQRLASRQAPRLGDGGLQIRPGWVRQFLIDSQSQKPGALMPDMLGSLSVPQRAEVAEFLTQYLYLVQTHPWHPNPVFSPALVNEGRELYHKVGCVACHAPRDLPAGAELRELTKESAPLGNF